MISFLLILGFVSSAFSGCFGCKFLLLFICFILSWNMILLLYTSLLAVIFLCLLLWLCCYLYLSIFYILLWILQWPICGLVAYCLAAHSFCFPIFFSSYLVVDFYSYSIFERENAWNNSNFFFVFTKAWAVAQDMTYPGECSTCNWDEIIFCWFVVKRSIDIKSIWSSVSFRACVS